jgi:hypothetical protein
MEERQMNKEKYYIKVKRASVEVTKDIYLEYYRSKRRDRYFEHDLKAEVATYRKDGHVIGYKPSKEDSLDRLMETGADFSDQCESLEDIVINGITVEILNSALRLLPEDEWELIEALFYSNDGDGMTERAYTAICGIPHQTIDVRKIKILARLKKILENKK